MRPLGSGITRWEQLIWLVPARCCCLASSLVSVKHCCQHALSHWQARNSLLQLACRLNQTAFHMQSPAGCCVVNMLSGKSKQPVAAHIVACSTIRLHVLCRALLHAVCWPVCSCVAAPRAALLLWQTGWGISTHPAAQVIPLLSKQLMFTRIGQALELSPNVERMLSTRHVRLGSCCQLAKQIQPQHSYCSCIHAFPKISL